MHTARSVTPDDIDLICRHRQEMFKASGRSDAMVEPMGAPFRAWLAPRLADGRYFGWVVEEDGAAIAGVGMMVIDWPPHPSHMTQDFRGYILNMYVEPAHRRRGLAKELMRLAEDEGARRGISYLVLHATTQGKPLYEQMDWKATTEMSLSLPREKP